MESEKVAVQPKLNIRHDWYQTESTVVVTILIRNVKQENLTVNFSDTALSLKIELTEIEEVYNLALRLAHKVVAQQCSYKILQSKIEIKLKKHEGIQWTELEGDASDGCPTPICSVTKEEGAVPHGPPKYPSSNPLHRDWNQIEKEIVKELAQDKPAGEEGVNDLFQKIYGEGSDEVRRAMNKSYVESGGTVLSTNWKEIAKDTVPVKPPDGMEWKQWNK